MASSRRLSGVAAAQADALNVEEGEFIDASADAIDNEQWAAFDELRNEGTQSERQLVTWVYLVPTDDKGQPLGRAKMEWLFTVPVDQANIEQIIMRVRDEFMTEADDKRWLIRAMVRESGVAGVKWNKTFVVRQTPGSRVKKETQQAQSQLGEIVGSVQALVQAQQTRSDQMLQQMALMMQRPAAQPETFGMREMIAAQTAAKNESMQMMAMLLTAMRPGGEQKSGMSDMIEMVRSLNGLKNELGGDGGGGGGGMMSQLAPFAPAVAEFMKVLQKGAVPAAAPLPMIEHQPQPAPSLPPPTTSTDAAPQGPEGKPDMLSMMRDQLAALAEIAVSSPDPKLIAENLLGSIPEEYDQQFYAMMADPNWFARLAAMQSKIAPHQAWLTKVRDEILASYKEDEE